MPEIRINNEARKIADKFYGFMIPLCESFDNTDCFDKERKEDWKKNN